ncbi:Ferrous iron transport protein B [compost metagenome]
MDQSFLAKIGGLIGQVLTPLGFGSWQAGAALITGFLAKEVVVSTMNIIYAAPDTATLQGLLAGHFTALQAYSFMAFILLYVPCLATVGVIRKETMSARWTWFSVLYALVIAYIISYIIMLVGRALGYN